MYGFISYCLGLLVGLRDGGWGRTRGVRHMQSCWEYWCAWCSGSANECFSCFPGSAAYDLFTQWPGPTHCHLHEERRASHGWISFSARSVLEVAATDPYNSWFVKIAHLAACHMSERGSSSRLKKRIQVSRMGLHLIELTLLVATEWPLGTKKAEHIRPWSV
jgi:hypothetical protein